MEVKRETFSNRLGFILLSAGCAIGIGNVYKFPLMTGYYGGGFFVLFYILFLIILGFPLMTMELSVGRASKKSLAKSFDELEKPKQKWHLWKFGGIIGNYLLMMCYLIIVGWILIYLVKYINGNIMDYNSAVELNELFSSVVSNNTINIIASFIIIILGFGICAIGLKNGVEKISKILMIALFVIIIGMITYTLTLSGAKEGIKFYLLPSVSKLKEVGIVNTISAAMSQAFFTLGIGIGSIAIFGSYIDKKRSLVNESIIIIVLDTLVAILCGFIIFPACFTFQDGVSTTGNVSGSFIYTTFSSIFNTIGGISGRIIGIVFFLLLLFAAFSTVLAVFENIIAFWIDLTNLSRPVIALINIGIMCLLVLPGIFGNTVWSNIKLFDFGIMDLEDVILNKIILPIGCLIYSIFCTYNIGWGFDCYLGEVNTGQGIKISHKFKIYLKYVLPIIIIMIMIFNFAL